MFKVLQVLGPSCLSRDRVSLLAIDPAGLERAPPSRIGDFPKRPIFLAGAKEKVLLRRNVLDGRFRNRRSLGGHAFARAGLCSRSSKFKMSKNPSTGSGLAASRQLGISSPASAMAMPGQARLRLLADGCHRIHHGMAAGEKESVTRCRKLHPDWLDISGSVCATRI